jgi:hypothetical protein
MLTTSTIGVDRPVAGLLMGKAPDVASKRLLVLHIRLNLPES